MGKVIRYEEELERLRKQRQRLEEEERLRKAIEESPDLDQTFKKALEVAVYDVAKYLKDVPQDRIPSASEKLEKYADRLLFIVSRQFVDYVDERIKTPGLDKSEGEKERSAQVVKEEAKRRVGGFAKLYRKAFEDAREGVQKVFGIQVPNEALPIVIVLAMVKAFGAVVELLSSAGSFGVGLAALGLDKYYKAKLSKAIEVAEEGTGERMDEEAKEQLYKLVGEGVSTATLKSYVSKGVGEDFGEVFAKTFEKEKFAPSEYKPQLDEKLLRFEEKEEEEKQFLQKQEQEEKQAVEKQEHGLDLSATVETEEWLDGKVISFPKPPSPGLGA